MKFYCAYCGKSVTNELPNNSLLRGECKCPECIESLNQVSDNVIEKIENSMLVQRDNKTPILVLSYEDWVVLKANIKK